MEHRQPADADRGGGVVKQPVDQPHVLQDRVMADHHAARCAGRPGGVLQQAQGSRIGGGQPGRVGGLRQQIPDRHDRALRRVRHAVQGRPGGFQQRRGGQHQDRLRIRHDRLQPRGRGAAALGVRGRDRGRPRGERAEERESEVEPRGIEQQHPLPRGAPPRERRPQRRRALGELAVAQRPRRGLAVAQKGDGRVSGPLTAAQRQHLHDAAASGEPGCRIVVIIPGTARGSHRGSRQSVQCS